MMETCPFDDLEIYENDIDLMPDNDVVLSGKAPCFGKDKVQEKENRIKMNSTNYLFRT